MSIDDTLALIVLQLRTRNRYYFIKVESRGVLVGALALGFTILTLLKLIPYIGFPWLWLATVLFGIGAMVLSQKTLQLDETSRL